MAIKQRVGTLKENYYYRFSYNREDYCEGGFRTKAQAIEAERLKRDSLIQDRLHPGKPIVRLPQPILFPEACDIYLRIHGPSLKGGVTKASRSQYGRLKYLLATIKKAWAKRCLDTISKYDVRDFLVRYHNVGTVMRYIGVLTKLFRSFEEWNKDPNVFVSAYKLPPYNPATHWRREMKSSQKKELPRTRVLSPKEWTRFKVHLKPRTLSICEIALKRFLRLADIKQISQMLIRGETIEGLQAKTGEAFKVPVMMTQPDSYDFTNFKKDFKAAQVMADMDWPVAHPLHFTPRDLRRTGATWAYHRTHDLRSIQKMLGHTQLSTTERYLHVSYENLEAIAKAVDSIADGHSAIATELQRETDRPNGHIAKNSDN